MNLQLTEEGTKVLASNYKTEGGARTIRTAVDSVVRRQIVSMDAGGLLSAEEEQYDMTDVWVATEDRHGRKRVVLKLQPPPPEECIYNSRESVYATANSAPQSSSPFNVDEEDESFETKI